MDQVQTCTIPIPLGFVGHLSLEILHTCRFKLSHPLCLGKPVRPFFFIKAWSAAATKEKEKACCWLSGSMYMCMSRLVQPHYGNDAYFLETKAKEREKSNRYLEMAEHLDDELDKDTAPIPLPSRSVQSSNVDFSETHQKGCISTWL